jgi:DNA-binding winged helix-turn-helix (wHTH) protein/tetratricopeptide (TPR) repeat protein
MTSCYDSSHFVGSFSMGSSVTSGRVFRFGLFEADVARSTLTRSGVRVKIQDQPFRVLIILLQRPGEIVAREELRQQLWPEGTYVDFEGSLNVILKKLRAALNEDSANPRFIETVPRRGYRFIAPVSQTTSPEADITQAEMGEVPQQAAPAVAAGPFTAPDKRRTVWRVYAGGAAVLALAAAITWLSVHRRNSLATPYDLSLQANAQVPLRKSVAVLGFHNASGRPEDAWLSTAFSEMLSTELAGGDKLRLVSGQEVSNLRLSSPWPESDTLEPATTARIGNALNSDLLVLGSYTVIAAPDRGELRLDVRLQQAKSGEILTEIAQTGDRQDLFRLISGVGTKLRTRLGVPQLAEPEQSTALAAMPSNREAARLYSLGLVKLREFDALAAKDLLQQACNADPKFAPGHAMLARAWSRLGYEQKRKQEARRALELAGSLSRLDRMQVEGDYYESISDHERAGSIYRAMFELFPDNVEYGLQLASAEDGAGHDNLGAQTVAQLRRLPPPASEDPRIDLLDARVGATNDPARLVLIRSAERKASAEGKKLIYAQARKAECENLNYSDHPNEAPPLCEEAYNVFMSVGNRLAAADAVRILADYEGSRGNLEKAITTYERALKILRELGEHYKTGEVLNNMAINYANQGKLDRAEQLYRQAQVHFEEAGDRGNAGTVLGNIADILFLKGNLGSAGKVYQEAVDALSGVDHSNPGYLLYRLADLNLTQGHVAEAHRLAQRGIDSLRANQGGYGYLSEAMIELGEILMAEANLSEAHQQFQGARELDEKVGQKGSIAESKAELAELAIEQGHPDQAESLIRPAIAEFEQEKSDPGATSGYFLLSRALRMQGKTAEAEQAIALAAELSRTSPDPNLKLPVAIEQARIDMAQAASRSNGPQGLERARQQLQSAIGMAKKSGYYMQECEARLALGELETRRNPAQGRSQLSALATEARSHGLELIARKAEQAGSAGVIAANKPLH